MAEKFVSFEDAVKELKKSPDELKGLVEEGKIRSFMDAGKMKFRRKDLDDLKTSLGIAPSEEEELSLAPADELPEIPPMPAPEAEEAPAAPAAVEEEFGIEPLDDEPAPAQIGKAPAKRAAAPAPAAAAPAEEEEVASLSDFEIGEDAEERGEALGEEEAELLSVQAPAFKALEEPQGAGVAMTAVLVLSALVAAFAAVMVMSFAFGADIPVLTSLFAK